MTENTEDTPLFKVPAYLYGMLLAERQLMLALADLTIGRDSWRELSLQKLEQLKTAFLAQPLPEATGWGIDATAAWLKTAGDPGGLPPSSP